MEATEGGLSSGGGRLFGGQLGLAIWINLLFISSEQALSGLKRSPSIESISSAPPSLAARNKAEDCGTSPRRLPHKNTTKAGVRTTTIWRVKAAK